VPQHATSRPLTKGVASLESITDPLARLDALRAARETLEGLEIRTVHEARSSGATWAQIGALYGISKQAAQQRFRGAV
jgi:hypothetical protein